MLLSVIFGRDQATGKANVCGRRVGAWRLSLLDYKITIGVDIFDSTSYNVYKIKIVFDRKLGKHSFVEKTTE